MFFLLLSHESIVFSGQLALSVQCAPLVPVLLQCRACITPLSTSPFPSSVPQVQCDARVKKLEEEMAVSEDMNQKMQKEKKMLDERASDLAQTLVEEEERSKHLTKLKTKHESTISDLEERLRKEQQLRQELERVKRRLETEINDLKVGGTEGGGSGDGGDVE